MKKPDVATRRAFLTGTAAAVLPLCCGTGRSRAAVRDEPRWQLGCYTRPWDQFDYRVAFDGVAQAGYPYVGLMTHKGKTWVMITPATGAGEAATYKEEARARGLKILSVYGDLNVAGPVEQGVRDLRHLVELCAECGAPNLLLGGTTEASRFPAYYKTVAECCDFAAEKGVALSIKPHGGSNATGPACRKIVELVRHRNFRLTYDPGNILYYSDGRRDPVDDAATVDGLVTGMCVKDFKPPKEVLVTPGSGRVRFKEVFARLYRGGFTGGPLVVECLDRGDAAAVTREAAKALAFVKTVIAGVS